MGETEGTVSKGSIFIVGVMLSGAFIAILNQTVLSPALPKIMSDLGITAVQGQWLTTAFMLVNGIMIPITAFLINRFSTRQLFITSMAFFTAGTAVAGFADSFFVLLSGRILQAIAAGVLMPMIQTVILLIFPKAQRGKAMGIVGIVIAAAPAIGPTLAGWVVDSWGWNSLFQIIAAISLVDMVFAIFSLKNVGETQKSHFDGVSVIFSTLGFGGLLYGCSNAGIYGWIHPLTWAPLLVGITVLILFTFRQLRGKEPLLELRVLKTKAFAHATIIGMLVNAALISGTIITPLYLQNILHFTAMQSGLVMLPGAIIMTVMSPITGNLFDRVGPRVLAVTGLAITSASSIAFFFCNEHWTFLYLCLVYTIRMFGISLVFMPLTTWGLNALDNSFLAHGSAINNTLRQISGSIGTAILVTVMTIFTQARISAGPQESMMWGIHMSFGAAAGIAVAAFIMAFLFVRNPKEDDIFCD